VAWRLRIANDETDEGRDVQIACRYRDSPDRVDDEMGWLSRARSGLNSMD